MEARDGHRAARPAFASGVRRRPIVAVRLGNFNCPTVRHLDDYPELYGCGRYCPHSLAPSEGPLSGASMSPVRQRDSHGILHALQPWPKQTLQAVSLVSQTQSLTCVSQRQLPAIAPDPEIDAPSADPLAKGALLGSDIHLKRRPNHLDASVVTWPDLWVSSAGICNSRSGWLPLPPMKYMGKRPSHLVSFSFSSSIRLSAR
jgi:hypothetical protein